MGVYCREIEIAIMHDLGFARAALLAGGEDLGDNLISASLLAHSLTHILSTISVSGLFTNSSQVGENPSYRLASA